MPALIYLAAPMPRSCAGRWAIPAATDIALRRRRRAPLGNRTNGFGAGTFRWRWAIIDDLGAIVVIALFYTNDLSVLSLAVAAGAIVVLAALNLRRAAPASISVLVRCCGRRSTEIRVHMRPWRGYRRLYDPVEGAEW